MSRIGAVLLLALGVTPGCFDNLPADAGPAEVGPAIDTGTDAGVIDTGVVMFPDASPFATYDAGPPRTCARTCECPQGQACTGGICRTLGAPVYCCDNEGCPGRAACLDDQDQPGVCDGLLAVPDAGFVAVDAGPQGVGGECTNNGDCDQNQSLVCWTRANAPFLWDGYCTVEDCGFGATCPVGSVCFSFDADGFITACLKTCFTEPECRSSATCFLLPGQPFGGACIPNCRDDLVDCFPKDGTSSCNATIGQCAPTPSHLASAEVGDPCVDSTQCANGQICMGEIGWGFGGGMCTVDCSAFGCGPGETCQPMPGGFQVCFKDCVGGMCPNRVGATCSMADPNWLTTSCVP